MNTQRNKYYLIAAVIFVSFIISLLIFINSHAQKKEIIKQTKERLFSEIYLKKKSDIEHFFTLTYQTIRTIGLLPSVQSIKGKNRSNDEEDVVARGDFSQEGHLTVQQLYNNLVSNVNISEIYAVLDGFTSDEIPFFMYDSLIVGEGQDGSEEGNRHSDPDYPEESEEEEYAYYPLQLAYFKQNHPKLNINKLDDIPAISSPPMRTCDNTQYISKTSGNPVDSFGVLYSVPFYDNNDAFRGIISAIFRLNVLEALLLDVPFIIVNENEKRKSGEMGFQMPDEKGDFVLVNNANSVFIGDRRDAGLINLAREMISSGTYNDDVYAGKLDIKDNNQWMLFYRFNESVISQAVRSENNRLIIQLAATGIITIIILMWVYVNYRKKRELMSVAQEMMNIAEGEGDLTRRLMGTWKGEVGELVRWVNVFIEKIHRMVNNVKNAGEGVSNANKKLLSASDMIFEKMSVQTGKSDQVATASTEMSQAVNDIARNSTEIVSSVNVTLEQARKGGEVVKAAIDEVLMIKGTVSDLAQLVTSLGQKSKDIGEIVNVINDIADQTNLLALNAAIEAARAGEQGKGFAVVADEVKKLAEKTSVSTTRIREMVNAIQEQTEHAGSAMKESLKRVQSGVDLSQNAGDSLKLIVQSINELQIRIQQIASSTEEISTAAEQVNSDMEEIASISRDTNEITGEMVSTTKEMSYSGKQFYQEISFFKTA